VLSMTTIHGVPVSTFIAKDKLEKIVDRTRKGGGEIVNLMGTSAYYAPASSAVSMAKAYLHDEKRVLACAAYLEGEYGYKDLYMGVPVVIGAGGVEKVVTIQLTADEKAMLEKSAAAVRELIEASKKL
jgi:malate dehydrogenase